MSKKRSILTTSNKMNNLNLKFRKRKLVSNLQRKNKYLETIVMRSITLGTTLIMMKVQLETFLAY